MRSSVAFTRANNLYVMLALDRGTIEQMTDIRTAGRRHSATD